MNQMSLHAVRISIEQVLASEVVTVALERKQNKKVSLKINSTEMLADESA